LLSVKGVSKKFCRELKRSLFYGMSDIAADLLGGRRQLHRLRPGEFWALNAIDFQLYRGEALGLVGTNGAGKSTLLRIISGLIKPDIGTVRISGRLAPLIALGAGFNPILTGRENIYANMAILGLTTREIDRRFDAVVDFAEIEDAIDAPVQTYSSGMTARLGFACAVHTEPNVLLIDEVLAVGDARFKAKCFRRLHELRQKGVAFVLVNHNSQAILNVCNSAIYLSRGKLVERGDVGDVVRRYEQDLFVSGTEVSTNRLALPARRPQDSVGVDIRTLFFRDACGHPTQTLLTGEPLTFCVTCESHVPLEGVSLSVRISKVGGVDGVAHVLFLQSDNDGVFFALQLGRSEMQLNFPRLGLDRGTYTACVRLRKDSYCTFDVVESFRFTVTAECPMTKCQFYQPRAWTLVSPARPE